MQTPGEMRIREDLTTGHLSKSLVRRLKRKINNALKGNEVASCKIGITANPYNRVSWSDYEGYHEMVVIYKTTSLDYIQEVEYRLVKHFFDVTDNRAPGGGGSISLARPPYYLYMVLRHKKWWHRLLGF